MASASLGFVCLFLDKQGIGMPTIFLVMASSNLIGAVGIWFSTPSRIEYMQEASRVLNIPLASVDRSNLVGYTDLKLQIKELWGVSKIFPLINIFIFGSVALLFSAWVRWNGMFATKYGSWFSTSDFKDLTDFYMLVFMLVFIVCPLSGIALDIAGFKSFFMVLVLLASSMAVFEPIVEVTAQKIYIVLHAGFYAVYMNVLAKYTVLYFPTANFGIAQGLIVSLLGAGCLGMMTCMGADASSDWSTPLFYWGGAAFFIAAYVVFHFQGMPTRPPQNRFDSARHLVKPSGTLGNASS